MKRLVFFVIALGLGFGVKAQCPLSTAVDFTATDCHGTELHLFDILDGGQYVLIDFFFTTCGPCQQAVPKVVESYDAMGCNAHDVYYMEISDRNNDAQCQEWINTYGVAYPTIGSQGGGGSICDQYYIGSFPTMILIAPDRSILLHDLWPIDDAQTIITALENYGLQQHDCNTGVYEETIPFDTDSPESSVALFPNPAHGQVTLKGEHLGTVSVYNALGQKVEEFHVEGNALNINTNRYENGIYLVKAGEKTKRFIVKH